MGFAGRWCRRSSPVRLRNASSRPRAVISRSCAAVVGEQVPRDRVGVLGVDVDRLAADVDALDAGQGGQRLGVGSGQGGADGASGRECLDLAAGAVGDDPAVADQDDPVGVLVGLLEVVRREEDGAALLGVARGWRTRRRAGPRRPCRWSARRGAAGPGRTAEPSRTAAAAAHRPSTCRPCGRRWPRSRRCASTSSTGRGVGEEARHVGDGLAHREVLEQAAGLHHGGDEAAGDRLARLEAEHLDRSRSSGGRARAPCRWSWSCRRRWGRGRRRSRPARGSGRCRGRRGRPRSPW